ncbi:hypothetical protein V500_00201 [Pseudogymnoascus sp. VKM F-4518 (FW-2643)]|nr:hypothetical protein V500_00201 [Pseudogymnoascus sp. VKM F-4518 (FW-2643)]
MALDRSSSFSQQGSVDWVALSGGFLSISKEILQRLSGSSLDTYTVAVGHVLGSQFRLSSKGRINMQNALDNMNAYAGLQNVLWFGFGVKHPARAIGTTEQGTTLVALCAALAECFPHETAAEILNDMVSLESNLDMTPSVGEWLALIKSCAGILSTTMFSVRAEKLMGLENSDKPADPTDIATVLNAIGKITKHGWVSITIHGGKEARWIGALAEWLFGLTVTITDNQDEVVYTSCPDGQISQVNICSQTRHDQRHPDYRAPKKRNKSLEIADRTFYIEAVNEVLTRAADHKAYGGEMDTPTMNGRVRWENCLSTVFGVLFKELMKRPDRVASVISSAARIYGAIATAEEGVPTVVLEANVLYVESSFGATFVHNLLQRFPELLAIEQYLDQDSDIQTYKDAASKYRVSVKDIRDNCGCRLCAGLSREMKEKEVNCQVVLVELILRIGRLLSVVECAEGLYPKFTGFRKLYNMRGEEISANPKKYLPDPPGVHRYRLSDLKPPKMAPFVAMDNFPSHMEHALCLFTGRTSKDLNSNFSSSPAISVDGICIYLRILREIPDSPEMFAMLQICPGQILHQGKRFTQLTDRPERSMPPHSREHLEKEEALFMCALQGFITSVKLAVRETVSQLFLHYDLFLADGDTTGLHLQPYIVSEKMLTSYRRLSCSHSSNLVTGWGDGSDWDDSKVPELQYKFDEENRYKSWSMQSSDLGRCAVAGLYGGYGTNCVLVMRDAECLPCCRKVWSETSEVFKAENIIIIDKPDPHRPVRKFM